MSASNDPRAVRPVTPENSGEIVAQTAFRASNRALEETLAILT
jgi:hypothetical protein